MSAETVAGVPRRLLPELPGWATSPKIVAGGGLLGFFALIAIVGPWIAPHNPSTPSLTGLRGPSPAHWLGTTGSGQDILSQVLVGARDSMLVGIVAAALSEGVAVIVGIAAGYLEGPVSEVLSMLTNIFLVLPVLPLQIVLAGYLTNRGWFGIAVIIAVTAWPWGARILRAQTRSIRHRDYVHASRLAGDPVWRILLYEILPNVAPIVVTGLLLHVLLAIIVQTSLAYLGVGDPTAWSWGTILYWSQNGNAFLIGAWWWYVPPGVCVALVGAGLALVNLGLDEVVNPRLRTEHGEPQPSLLRRLVGLGAPR